MCWCSLIGQPRVGFPVNVGTAVECYGISDGQASFLAAPSACSCHVCWCLCVSLLLFGQCDVTGLVILLVSLFAHVLIY